LNNVGSNGFAWSASPDSKGSRNGGYLGFYGSGVNPLSNNFRSLGFPVRCAQE
jgi:hypothetical protein